jgi:hypothetical protein
MHPPSFKDKVMLSTRWMSAILGFGLTGSLAVAQTPKPLVVEEVSPIVEVTVEPLPGGTVASKTVVMPNSPVVGRPITVPGAGRSQQPVAYETMTQSGVSATHANTPVRSNWRPSLADGQAMSMPNQQQANHPRIMPVSATELNAPNTIMVAPPVNVYGSPSYDNSCGSGSGCSTNGCATNSCSPNSRWRLFGGNFFNRSACRSSCNWVICQPSLPVDPNGAKVNLIFQIQADEAKAEKMVFYREEFELDRENLKTISLAHVDRIANWMKSGAYPYILFPVRVEPTGDAKLDEERRMGIAKLLMERQALDTDQRVVVGFGKAEGLRGDEIDRVGRGAPANSGGGSGGQGRNGGGGLGGGFGGGGGGFGGGGGGLGLGNVGAIFGY